MTAAGGGVVSGTEGLSEEVVELAEALGEIRVAGAREADWWTSDDEHGLLIRVLKGECIPWAEGLLASDWYAALTAERDALREQVASELSMLHSEAMAHNLAEVISREQSVARAPHERRLGYAARLTLAKAVTDEVCRSLGFPDSIDAALHPTDGAS
jgi:hypothetical protein